MFDASAYELAEISEDAAVRDCPRDHSPTDDQAGALLLSPASLTLAACATCHKALGDCAINAAGAGVMPPVLALAVCNSVNRLVERAVSAQAQTWNSYLAFVLFGPRRTDSSRRADLETLAETMR